MELSGRVIFLCCQGCEEQVKADPARRGSEKTRGKGRNRADSGGAGASTETAMVNAVIRWCLNNTLLVVLAMLAVAGGGWYAACGIFG